MGIILWLFTAIAAGAQAGGAPPPDLKNGVINVSARVVFDGNMVLCVSPGMIRISPLASKCENVVIVEARVISSTGEDQLVTLSGMGEHRLPGNWTNTEKMEMSAPTFPPTGPRAFPGSKNNMPPDLRQDGNCLTMLDDRKKQGGPAVVNLFLPIKSSSMMADGGGSGSRSDGAGMDPAQSRDRQSTPFHG
jgi:hypothetical protein